MNIYSVSIRVPIHEANIYTTEKRDDKTKREGNSNVSFSIVDRKSRQMINKRTGT